MGKPEAAVENYLVDLIETNGGFIRKMIYQGRKDAPDRLVVLPGGFVAFCECKAPGESLGPGQELEAKEYAERNARYYVIDSRSAVLDLIEQWITHYDKGF